LPFAPHRSKFCPLEVSFRWALSATIDEQESAANSIQISSIKELLVPPAIKKISQDGKKPNFSRFRAILPARWATSKSRGHVLGKQQIWGATSGLLRRAKLHQEMG
jgi:hypothetical protein